MLSIYVNTMSKDNTIMSNPNYIDNPKSWFDNQGGRHFVTGDMERAIIKDIDDSEVISENLVENPIFGGISTTDISTTSKTVILVKNCPDKIFNGSRMGDNAAPWLLKIAEQQDVTIRLGYPMRFPEPFKLRIVNDNKIVTTKLDYLREMMRFL